MASLFHDLSEADLQKIKSRGQPLSCKAGECVFSEGDMADYLYFIASGQVSIFIEKFNTKVELQTAQPGDWFGEIAVFNGDRRTASAVAREDTEFLTIAKQDFMNLLASESDIYARISETVNKRNEDLVLREKMIAADGMHGADIHIGIKGDPSLRESAMERQRYESVVDRHLPELVGRFEDLLLNRSVHRIKIGFNNGEISISTVLDPFSEEFHPAVRLLDESYLDRHFPRIDYGRKAEIIRRLYQQIGAQDFWQETPDFLTHGFSRYYANWEPIPKEEISHTLAQLPTLRSIPNFYVRNMTVGILKDAIHMQFNCDGTHIVSAKGYDRFLEENL